MNSCHYVYMVECKHGTYYTGYTNDIDQRIKKHNEGKGAKYLRGRAPVRLVWLKKFVDKSSALRYEIQVKKLTKEQKNELVRGYRRKNKDN